MKRALLAMLLAVGLAAMPFAAMATPVAVGTMRAECAPNLCCAQFDFAAVTFDVFGNMVNLGSSVGQVVTDDTALTFFNPLSGSFAGSAESATAGLLSFDAAGNFLCIDDGCSSGSFVGDVFNIGGSVGLPGGASYTEDGTVVQKPPIGAPTILGCPLGSVSVFEGTVGLNAFQSFVTPSGSNVTVPASTTFFDSATGQQVNVSMEISFGMVATTAATTITAFSNAAGEIPSNFAAEVRGRCVDEPATSCCTAADCTTGSCSGCYRAAFVDVTTDASYSPPIEICSYYPDADNDGLIDGSDIDETDLYVLHDEGGTFVDRTSRRDASANLICAEVNSLSFFVVTAALDCPLTVDDSCRTGSGKGLLSLSDAPGKEKLVAKWIKGAAVAQAEMGNPLAGGSGTAYSVCIYDQNDDLAGQLNVDRAGGDCSGKPCWKSLGDPPPTGKGYKYLDKDAAEDGVKKVLFKAGADGKSKAIVKAKGANLPAGIAAALQTSASATIQFRASDGACMSQTLTRVVKATADKFKAK